MADSSNYAQPEQSTSGQTSQPIPLRGHHLTSLAHAYKDGRKRTEERFMEFEYNPGTKRKERYIDNPNHPIIDTVMYLLKLLENPELKFKIISDEPDLVCAVCEHPMKKRGECFDKEAALALMKMRVGPFFAGEIESDDIRIAKRHGFQIGEVYSSTKILEAIKDIASRSLA
jgi:hypothetical protein